ncbi:hypothetical protein B0H13DRAFT_2097656 [Mycena leptocephala]|nr:hypothetical protein B0H13DRAFT_2097656 [Mycena leptocephala]
MSFFQSATTPRSMSPNSDSWTNPTAVFAVTGEPTARSNTLHSTALTSRAFYHSAIPLLWRRLDIFRGLQTHYPGQRARVNGFYYLPGIIEDTDWLVFDRHATIVYALACAIYSFQLIAIQVREYAVDDHHRPFLYVSPSLVSVSLPALAPATETFLNMLSNHPLLFPSLIYRNLQSVSFMGLTGPVAQADFLALPLCLYSVLTTDMYGWHKHFCALIYLKIDGRGISIVSISVVCEDRRYRALEIPTAAPRRLLNFSAIATRWSTTFRIYTSLDYRVQQTNFGLPRLEHIRTFELSAGLNGPLNDARILAVICNWTELTSLPSKRRRGHRDHEVKLVDMHLLASHLDHLFPQLLWISADGWDHRGMKLNSLYDDAGERRAV